MLTNVIDSLLNHSMNGYFHIQRETHDFARPAEQAFHPAML